MSYKNKFGESKTIGGAPLDRIAHSAMGYDRLHPGPKAHKPRGCRMSRDEDAMPEECYHPDSGSTLRDNIELILVDEEGRIEVDGRQSELILLRDHQYGGSWEMMLEDMRRSERGARTSSEQANLRRDMEIIGRLKTLEEEYSRMNMGVKPKYAHTE